VELIEKSSLKGTGGEGCTIRAVDNEEEMCVNHLAYEKSKQPNLGLQRSKRPRVRGGKNRQKRGSRERVVSLGGEGPS